MPICDYIMEGSKKKIFGLRPTYLPNPRSGIPMPKPPCFDLTNISGKDSKSGRWTGTIAFMALQLIKPGVKNPRGFFRHGVESLICMESKTDLLGNLGCRLMAAYLLSYIIDL